MISTCLCVCIHIVVVPSPSHVQLFVTLWSAAHQSSLFLTISWRLPKLMFVTSVIPFSHLILWCSLLLLPSIFPSIRGFSSESAVHFRWSKYWSFHFSISPSNEYSGLISLETDWLDLLVLQRTDSQESSPAPQSESINKHQFSSVQLRLTLCDPMDCSMPGFPVHHELPELTQTHVHQVGDAIQPSHPLSSPSPPAFNLSQHQGLLSQFFA